MTQKEFNKKLEELGIKMEKNSSLLPNSIHGFRFYREISGSRITFKCTYSEEAVLDLKSIHGIDAGPTMRKSAIELLTQELQLYLLYKGKIEEFIKIFGWEILKEIASINPLVAKWLADPKHPDFQPEWWKW